MRYAIFAAALLSLSSSAFAKAKGKAKAVTKPATATEAPVSSAPSTAALETPEAAAKAMALPVAKFEEAALYTIATSVGGQEYALTWIVPSGEGVNPSAISSNASKSKIELQKPNGTPAQMWQPHDAGTSPKSYDLFNRVTDAGFDTLNGRLRVDSPDRRFIDDPDYNAKYNRLTIGVGGGETHTLWYIVQQPNGKYRIMSLLGHPENLNKNGETAPRSWDETRWLTGVAVGGKIVVRHQKAADIPGQEWTLTKVGTYFKE